MATQGNEGHRKVFEAPNARLADELLEAHGHVIGGQVLIRLLGYPTADAFQQAIRRGSVGVAVFALPGRRGKFALTRDVAEFLDQHRHPAEESGGELARKA